LLSHEKPRFYAEVEFRSITHPYRSVFLPPPPDVALLSGQVSPRLSSEQDHFGYPRATADYHQRDAKAAVSSPTCTPGTVTRKSHSPMTTTPTINKLQQKSAHPGATALAMVSSPLATSASGKDAAAGPDSSSLPSSSATSEAPTTPVPSMYWHHPKMLGSVPKRVRSHTLNVIGDKAYVFGGWDNRTCYSEVYILDIDTMYWSVAPTTGDTPDSCRAHTAVTVGNYLYIFGGGDASRYFNALYILNTETMVWSKPF
ncbi:hypothetical protein EV182_006362, partial [Spiromyces aspiralis]